MPNGMTFIAAMYISINAWVTAIMINHIITRRLRLKKIPKKDLEDIQSDPDLAIMESEIETLAKD